jgi:plastocyanin
MYLKLEKYTCSLRFDEHIDEEKLAIPPDMFSQDTIVVKKGNKVKIHFYNLEPVESQEHHTFTINDPAYKIHNDINAEENVVIEFTASREGVFDYLCTYHQPTMRGELVVLPSDD